MNSTSHRLTTMFFWPALMSPSNTFSSSGAVELSTRPDTVTTSQRFISSVLISMTSPP